MIRINGPRNRDWSEIKFHDGRYHRKHSPEPFMVESCTLHEAINQYCKKYKVSIKEEIYLGELKLVHKTLKKKKPVCNSVEIIVTLQVSPDSIGVLPAGSTLYGHRALGEIATYKVFINTKRLDLLKESEFQGIAPIDAYRK